MLRIKNEPFISIFSSVGDIFTKNQLNSAGEDYIRNFIVEDLDGKSVASSTKVQVN